MILAIDPGVHVSGVALGTRKGEVLACGHEYELLPGGVEIFREERDGCVVDWVAGGPLTVVCEKPVFRGRFAGDIAALCVAVGQHKAAALSAGARWIERTPEDWKKQEQKPHQHARAWALLATGERAIVAAALDRTPADVEAWIKKACTALALKTRVAYTRGRRVNTPTGKRTVKDSDILDAVCLLMVQAGRLR